MTVPADALIASGMAMLDDFFGDPVSCVFAAHDGTVDGHGQRTYTTAGDWDTVVTVAGHVREIDAAQEMRGGQKVENVTHYLRVTYSALIAVGQRITLPDGAIVYVKTIRDPDRRQRELIILASLTL